MFKFLKSKEQAIEEQRVKAEEQAKIEEEKKILFDKKMKYLDDCFRREILCPICNTKLMSYCDMTPYLGELSYKYSYECKHCSFGIKMSSNYNL